MDARTLLLGAGMGLGARAALGHVLLAKLRRDVARLNAGDHRPLLSAYHDGAVLRFDQGPHRWSGTHRGRAAIDRFLGEFVHAGLQGELRRLWFRGPLWALTLAARFDDRAAGPNGEELYANRTVLVVRTRWGRIVKQEVFYADTRRIDAFERALSERGMPPLDR